MKETILGMQDELDDLKNLLRILKLSVTRYHKNSIKRVEQLENKLNKKKKRKMKNPSGFAKPTEISEELCSFMNKPTGSKIPRTEVTKFLIGYIKNNNLQDEDKKSNIKPDEKLTKLLGKNDGVTYFTLQSLMNKHFIKYTDQEQKEKEKEKESELI